MCLRCLSRALKYLAAVEAAVSKTGGAAAVAVQVVHHAHCGDPLCANEGHVHVRVRRADHSHVEWIRANGTLDQFRECVARALRGLPIEVFDELFEADERGLAPEVLAVVASIASTIAPTPADGECAVCMEPLDASGAVGGFAKLRVAQLPCAHRFHLRCYTKWADRHTTCPCCRAEVSPDGVASLAREILPAGHPAYKLPALTRVAPAPTPAGLPPPPARKPSRLRRLLARFPRLPRVRAHRRTAAS